MQHFPAPKQSQGFTLIEIIVVLLVVGILSAIAAPSFLGFYNKTKTNDAIAQLKGAFQEAQRVAIRNSKTCVITLPTPTPLATSSISNPTITSPCFITGSRTLTGIDMRRSSTLGTVTFDIRGGTTNNGTMVLSVSNIGDNQANQKCMVISSGIGLMRTGTYSTSETSGSIVGSCNTSQ